MTSADDESHLRLTHFQSWNASNPIVVDVMGGFVIENST